MPRLPRLSRALVVGLCLSVLVACGSSPKPSGPPKISGGIDLDVAMAPRISSMAFTNQDGKTVRLADFKGKNVLIQDTMTLCQEECPIDTATFVASAREYAKTAENPNDTVFLSITVDPARDNPAQLKAYKAQYAPAGAELPNWQLLTASKSDIAALWKYFHVYWEKVKSHGAADEHAAHEEARNWRTGELLTYDIAHGNEVFFLDKTLTQRYLLNGMPSLAGQIPAKIHAFMTAEGHHNMGTDGWTVENAMTVLEWVNTL